MSRHGIDIADIEARLLALLSERGPGRTLGPMDVARALGGDHPDGWGPLMQPIRAVAVRLTKEGRAVLLRKGRPVDPDDFRGVYRIALPGHGVSPDGVGAGEGKEEEGGEGRD